MVQYVWLRFIGMKRTALANAVKKLSVFWIKIMSKETKKLQFAICISNEGYEDDLKLRMVYRVLPDESAARSSHIRIVDETGEDYLYPAPYFVMIDVPQEAEPVLLRVA